MTAPPSPNQAPVVGTLDYHHPLEKWLSRNSVRYLLRRLAGPRADGKPPYLERALLSYADPDATLGQRLAYAPVHWGLRWMRGSLTAAELRQRIVEHRPTLRGIVATAASVGQYGLTTPQRWANPLFVVWNFTNRCDLRCQHCYQDSGGAAEGELTTAEKLDVIDQLGRAHVAMVAFAGGEPTLSADLEPVLRRCRDHGMHTSLATHGGRLTPERCARLAEAGLRYVEVSLDSPDPRRHDQFRGVNGAWERAVAGIRNVVATDGLRAGIAMCVHRDNLDEVEPMLELALSLGAQCLAHFNFIPVGRGVEMAELDITPEQREQLLGTLHEWMQARRIGVISTAPQFGRFCMMHAHADGLVSCSHAGNGAGTKARVVARYLGGCGAGRTYACLQPNGAVTPCVYMPDRVMGSVRDKPFTQVFQESPWWDLFCDRDARQGHCGRCDYRLYCGGCRARADAYFRRLDHSDPGCVHNGELWRQVRRQSAACDERTASVSTP